MCGFCEANEHAVFASRQTKNKNISAPANNVNIQARRLPFSFRKTAAAQRSHEPVASEQHTASDFITQR
jgi:hypothetical protein